MARAKEKKHWSENFGERGRNWVRAYQDGRDRKFYLEYMIQVMDPDTEQVITKRKRVQLRDVTTASIARQRGRRLSEKFGRMADTGGAQTPLTMARLFTLYTKEVTPTKPSASKRGHDLRAARVFTAYFDSQVDAERRSSRHPSTLDRVDWDGFIAARRTGAVPGWKPVRDRQVEYDLTFMISVLNWATGAKVNGAPLLERNPWCRETRRAQKWVKPRERSPQRPTMTPELREQLLAFSPSWQFELALVLERETRRRNSAIRQLRWSDIDLVAQTVQWRGEVDKAKRWNVTPLSPAAVAALKAAPRGIREAPVFPSAENPAQCTPRNTFQIWLRRAKDRLLRSITDVEERERVRVQLRRVGYHSEKRAGVRDPEFRKLPPAIQEAIAGTDFDTMRKVYDDVSVEDIRRAWLGTGSGTELPAEVTAGG